MSYLSEKKIQQKLRDGAGAGYGQAYKPWHTVNEISGYGNYRVRLKGRSGRIFHLASREELYTLLYLEKNPKVIDIREQYPIDRNITYAISKKVGINHPGFKMRKNPTPQVMTVDFLCDIKDEQGERSIAIAVISENDLIKFREYQLWEIVRLACEVLGFEFYIVTNNDRSQDIVAGMDWAFRRQNYSSDGINEDQLGEVHELIFQRINQAMYKKMSIRDFCNHLDKDCSLSVGMALSIFRSMLSLRFLDFDYFRSPCSEKVKIRDISEGVMKSIDNVRM